MTIVVTSAKNCSLKAKGGTIDLGKLLREDCQLVNFSWSRIGAQT